MEIGDYITIQDLADKLEVSKSTVDRWIATKVITKRRRFGLVYLYKLDEVKKEVKKYVDSI